MAKKKSSRARPDREREKRIRELEHVHARNEGRLPTERTHPDYQAFVRAIIADPDNDVPRLVFADWLEEHGDPRGEFIRVQVKLAQIQGERESSLFRELHRREIAALEASKEDWFAIRRRLDGWDCRRGFLEEARLDFNTFLAIREELFSEHPIRQLTINGQLRYQEVVNFPPVERLTHLALMGGDGSGLISPDVAHLLIASRIIMIPEVEISSEPASREVRQRLKKAFGKRLRMR